VLSLEFHPAGQLLFTAGLDKHLRFFQVISPPFFTIFVGHTSSKVDNHYSR